MKSADLGDLVDAIHQCFTYWNIARSFHILPASMYCQRDGAVSLFCITMLPVVASYGIRLFLYSRYNFCRVALPLFQRNSRNLYVTVPNFSSGSEYTHHVHLLPSVFNLSSSLQCSQDFRHSLPIGSPSALGKWICPRCSISKTSCIFWAIPVSKHRFESTDVEYFITLLV